MDPRESRLSLGEGRGEFEEHEDWDPAPEEEFLRDTLEVVDPSTDDGDDDASFA